MREFAGSGKRITARLPRRPHGRRYGLSYKNPAKELPGFELGVMKTHTRKFLALATALLTLAAADLSRAQAVATEVTTSAGTISEFTPGAMVIRSETSPTPIRYTYSDATTYEDEAGAPVAIETVRTGVPVTIHYSTVGGQLVASRVVVRRTVAAPTTTTVVPVVPAAPVVIEKKTTTTTTVTEKDDD